ncbi:MAG: glycosyltransferase family 2 protein [Candidatus Uhrbacteria bacterium]
MKYDVAVITVTKDKIDPECLPSVGCLLRSSNLKIKFVLVDNNSTTFEAHSLVKQHLPKATVILRNQNYGMGHSSNRGAAEVEADYYFFLNPDTVIIDLNLLDQLRDFLQACPKIGLVAPQVCYPDGRVQDTCRRFPKWFSPIAQRTSVLSKTAAERHRQEFLMEDYNHQKVRMVDWVQGSAFMIESGFFKELGGFDERFFMYYEDVDLCRRCWQKNRPVYYLPEVKLLHSYGKGSAVSGGLIKGLLKNRMARAHIVSWIKYTFKWFGKKI